MIAPRIYVAWLNGEDPVAPSDTERDHLFPFEKLLDEVPLMPDKHLKRCQVLRTAIRPFRIVIQAVRLASRSQFHMISDKSLIALPSTAGASALLTRTRCLSVLMKYRFFSSARRLGKLGRLLWQLG